jgi:CheY-like chemotaxis protein
MKVRADAKGLALTLDYRGAMPIAIRTDPIRLRQILVNLIGNAIKFTEVGGVRVVVSMEPACNNERMLRVDVIDTGIGISEKGAAALFQPFSQVDMSTHRRFGGTGLGLTISKRLAKMLGGDITVASVLGKGSTFSLTVAAGSLEEVAQIVPAVKAFASDESAPRILPRLDGRILLAEDGPDNQRLIVHILRKAGAEVTVADNGQSAVDLALAAAADEDAFDVILMDIQMPIIDGYEATHRLRNAGYARPIIALTAHAMKQDQQNCMNAGCDDYLTKPIDRAALLNLVAKHLHGKERPKANLLGR